MAQVPREPPARYAHSRQEAADIIGVSVKKIDSLIVSGDLPAVRLGRFWRISDSALRALVGQAPTLEST